MLGTMAGLWISIFVVFFGGLMLIGSIAGSSSGGKVEKHSVLCFDLDGTVNERYQPSSLMQTIQEGEMTAPSLDEMLRSLRLAANDDKIEALVLRCNGSAMGFASRQELVEAIRQFKFESGKPVYAYAYSTYTQGDYMLASLADKIFLNPLGGVDIHGVGGMVPFFTETLDKIGVKMQILKVGTFKSAVEPFCETSMSEPARLQMQQYCDSLWGYAVNTISGARNIEGDSLRTWAGEVIGVRPASFFIDNNFVDELAYEREFEDNIRILTDRESNSDIRWVKPAEYLAANESIEQMTNATKKHIAIYYAVGDITDNSGDGIVGTKVVPDIISLADNDKVEGLVLRVNSGGGSAFASEQIWEALEYFKSKDKPFFVSMGDYAASGGYYISSGANMIFADSTTITGSIGVFGMIPDFSGLATGILGVHFSTVETNPNAVGITGLQPMTPSMKAAMQTSVENTYATFLSRVAEGRNMTVEGVDSIAQGRVWVGSTAIQLGLVDRMGSLRDCVLEMANQLDMDKPVTVAYPDTEEELLVRIIRESGGLSSVATPTASFSPSANECFRVVDKLRNMSPVQARMAPVIIQ